MQNRRAFIKTGCTVCASIVGAGFIATALSSCGTSVPLYKTAIDNNLIVVPAASFTTPNKLLMVRGKNLNYDVLLIKVTELEYRALLMKCTHRDNPLTANDKGLFCAEHGSIFDLSGNVVKEPALKPLKNFNTTIADHNIIIHLNS